MWFEQPVIHLQVVGGDVCKQGTKNGWKEMFLEYVVASVLFTGITLFGSLYQKYILGGFLAGIGLKLSLPKV